MAAAIWWIRRDLRLNDNQALTAACQSASEVIPLFIIDPKLEKSPGISERRKSFLWDGLRGLQSDIEAIGGRLVIRRGTPVDVLTQIFAEHNIQAVYAGADYTPYALLRDQKVGAALPLNLIGGSSLSHPGSILKSDQTPYTVFTPYSKAWLATNPPASVVPLPPPARISTPPGIAVDSIPKAEIRFNSTIFPAGETASQTRLKTFTEGENPLLYGYSEDRNRMDIHGTSQLSPYLRFGMISPGQAIASANASLARTDDPEAQKGVRTWINELIWREFYISILYHYPHVLKESFQADYDRIQWVNDKQDYADWCEGRTGYPVVDAAMRQLLSTGWMHNRARMIVASFLVKDLLIDWRWGERWFMKNLLDGDPAANNGGWQWTAGTGTDAAPYFRIFNPILQGKKFDPQGDYIKRWVPELSRVPANFLHTPWEMPEEVQWKVGCVIGHDYPRPIIDHQFARERTLQAYKMVKSSRSD